jgi:hypothetical protein
MTRGNGSEDMSPARRRAIDLACDRALFGIDADEERELVALLDPTDDLALGLERAAAAVALAELVIDEPLPDHLAQTLLATAMSGAPRARAGTVPITPVPLSRNMAMDRSEARTSVMVPHPPPMMQQPSDLEAARARRAANDAAAAPARRSSSATWAWLAAAACFALAVGTLVLSRRPDLGKDGAVATAESPAARRDRLLAEAKDLVRVPWSATDDPAGKAESGEVVWSSARQEGYMTFRGLAANDPTKEQYQLWIFDAERDEKYPVDGGVFDVKPGAGGGGEIVIPITARVSVATPKLFAVTVEKPGGVVVSKRERIAVAAPVSG